MKNLSRLFLIFASIALVSCGENTKEQEQTKTRENTSSSTSQTTSPTSTEAVEEMATVNLSADDQMKFNKNEIRVKAGQTVSLTLKHTGQMPKNAMGHNFVLLKQGTDINEFGQAAAVANENDYIPEGTDRVIANTPVIGGGEEATIEFEAPERGTYRFICSFPGHYAIMQGEFIVE